MSRQDFSGERASQPASEISETGESSFECISINLLPFRPWNPSHARRVEPDQIEVESLVDFDAKRNAAAKSSNRAKAELRHLSRSLLDRR